MISLVDNFGESGYYSRAWCCAEVLLLQTLEKSYRSHLRVEHIITNSKKSPSEGRLERPKRIDRLMPSEQRLSVEADRPHIQFLERQMRLLDKS